MAEAQLIERIQNAETAIGVGRNLETGNAGSVTLQVSGTFVGTVTFEGSINQRDWDLIKLTDLSSGDRATSTTAAGTFAGNTSGVQFVRARISAYTSGSISVDGVASPDPFDEGDDVRGLIDGRPFGIVSVTDYGAKGDGTTDDSTAIAAAVTAVSNLGGGIVLFPRGTHLVSKQTSGTKMGGIILPDNVSLVGQDPFGTVLKMAADQSGSVPIVNVLEVENVQVLGLGFDGNYDNNADLNEHAHGVFIYSSDNVLVDNCRFKDCVGDGVSISGDLADGKSTYVRVNGCDIRDSGRNGVTIEDADHIKITNNTIEIGANTGATCIDFDPIGAQDFTDAIITGNTLIQTGSGALVTLTGKSLAHRYKGIAFADNICVCTADSTAEQPVLIRFTEDVIFANNRVDLGVGQFRSDHYNRHLTFSGNKITTTLGDDTDFAVEFATTTAATDDVDEVLFVGNEVVTNGGAVLVSGASHVKIADNSLIGAGTANSAEAIKVWSTVDAMEDVEIQGNRIRNFTQGVVALRFSTFTLAGLIIAGNTFDTITDAAEAAIQIVSGAMATGEIPFIGGNITKDLSGDVFDLPSGFIYQTGGTGGGVADYAGDGTPESNLAAPVGSTYQRSDGVSGESLYVKETGTGSTGWVARGVVTPKSSFPTASATNRGQTLRVEGVMGVAEVASLTVTAAATSSGNVTVTLDGTGTNVAVTNGDTIAEVATAIRGTSFAGWTTGGTGATVTFTATATGAKTDATYSAGTTGATGTMSTTTDGVTATADAVKVCVKKSDDTYEWHSVLDT